MTTETKLLTEAELRRDLTDACVGVSEIERLVRKWGERGLIAEEPDKREAAYQAFLDRLEPGGAGFDMKFIFCAGYDAAVQDMELAPRKLTREMVEEMTFSACDAAYREVYCDPVPEVKTLYVKAFARHFHTALTEALQ